LNDQGLNEIDTVQNVTVRYVDVTKYFRVFPEGFDHRNHSPTWSKRESWSYQHMCRFFSLSIWEVPDLFPYGKLLRLDSDSQLLPVSQNPFFIVNDRAYMISSLGRDDAEVTVGLPAFGDSFLRYDQKTPENQKSYQAFVIEKYCERCDVLLYQTNFWVINVQRFLELPGLLRFFTMVEASYGIYLYRWGDAPMFYLILAIAAKPEDLVMIPSSWNYTHGYIH
jgi:hypothetical protein